MSNTLSLEDMNHELFQPMMGHVWKLELDGIPAYTIKTANRPGFTIGEATLDWGNKPTRKISTGKITFSGNLDVALWEPINPSGAQVVMAWIRAHSDNISGRAGYAAMYKKDVLLSVADPMGNIVQRWLYKNCHIASATFSALDHENPNLTDIQLSLSYDNCILLH
jgi:hypothetical protein